MKIIWKFVTLTFVLVCMLPQSARASDDVILTVTASATPTEFDRAALEELPGSEFQTTTIWTEGVQHFRGVRMVDLLRHLGISSGTLQLTAANDYSISIPVESFRDEGAMLAFERNGMPMTLRSKGPIWLVYPYDTSPDFQSEEIYSNSIWQLDRISLTE